MKTVCYDLGKYRTENLEFKNCPSCHACLKVRNLEASGASAAQCPRCGWWALRLKHYEYELYYPLQEEYIVMNDSTEPCAVPKQGGQMPWDHVWDAEPWQNAIPMPLDKVSELFGFAPAFNAKIKFTRSSEPSGIAQFFMVIVFLMVVVGGAFVIHS